MMLYSKNGSIPKPETDGTEGWIEVPEPPVAGDGQEVVWWCPPGWVVRPVCPNEPGMVYNWSQSAEQWIATAEVVPEPTEPLVDTGSAMADVFISGTAAPTIDLGSAMGG